MRIVALVVPLGAVACQDANGRYGPEVGVNVSPLTLPGVEGSLERACYHLSVSGEAGLVASEPGVCSDRWGDGKGSIAYAMPCDAGDGADADRVATNDVTLVLEDVWTDDGDDAESLAH